VIISDAFVEAQLDEGKIWDAIKKKLGGKASDEEIKAEVERLKGLDSDDIKKIKQTAQSRDFHARKKREAAAAKATGRPTPTRPTLNTVRGGHQSNDVWDDARGFDRFHEEQSLEEGRKAGVLVGKNMKDFSAEDWCEFLKKVEKTTKSEFKDQEYITDRIMTAMQNEGEEVSEPKASAIAKKVCALSAKMNEDVLEEGQDFTVSYKLRGSDAVKKVVLNGRNVIDIKRKFADSHYGAKLVSVEPSKVVVKKVEKVEEEESFGPLGPRS
jgi:hypothetical protein